MSLKEQYNIDDAAWQKLWKHAIVVLILFPSLFILDAGCVWAFIDDSSMVLIAIAILWSLLYLPIVLFIRIWLIRSKFRMLVVFIGAFSVCMFFAIISSVCVYSFWGITGFCIQNLLMMASGMFLSRYYYAYWDKVWESHEIYNETVSLDLKNGRYDPLNPFDATEDKVRITRVKKYSHSELMDIVVKVAPIGVAIPMIFKSDTMFLLIEWVLGVPLSLCLIKWIMLYFHLFKKVSYYEKKIGKPIINGLLPKPHGRNAKAARQDVISL